MKRFAWLGIGMALVAVGITGCEWNTGNEAESWSSSYNWVNFSGTYRSAAGGLLVTDYTTTPSTPGSTNTLTVVNETQPGFVAYQTVFRGKVKNGNVSPGSVLIVLSNSSGELWDSFTDDGNGVLTGGQGSGTISYVAGTWTYNLNVGLVGPVFNGKVTANYSYEVSNSGSTGSGALPGSTGSIFSFIVVHQGQNLTFTDNNGATYTGRIGEIRSTSGAQNTDIGQVGADEEANDTSLHAKYTYYESPLPEDGDTLIATFECSGVSAALKQVKIAGNLQGTVAAGIFTGRTLSGTWIELGGKTGDINGQTTSIPITSGTTTTDTTVADTTATDTTATTTP
jgi:hypothetical protein